MRRAFFEVAVARIHTLVSFAPWAARSSRESGRPSSSRHHSQVAASALRCRTGLCHRWSFCPPARGGHVTEQHGDIGSNPSSPRRVTREHRASSRLVSHGTLLHVRLQPLALVELDHAWAGDSRWVHSHPVHTYAPADSPDGAVRTRDDWG